MRDLGWSKFDEPFTRLLTQGMVLNHIYSRHDRAGRHRVLLARRGRRRSAPTKAGRPARTLERRLAVDYDGIGTMCKSEEQRRRPAGADRPLRRRHRPAVRDVRLAARADARLERRRRRGRAPLPAAAVDLRGQACRRDRRAAAAATEASGSQGAAPRGARGAAQVSYDYERMQYNTVVSGAMKLLNALEAHALTAATRAGAARRLRHPAARALPGLPAHRPGRCGASSAMPRELGDLLDAPWPQVDESALVQDEIELVLQVNGKLRGSITVPARVPPRRRSRRPRWPARSSRGSPRAAGQEGDRRAGPARQHRRLMAGRRASVAGLRRLGAGRLRLRAARARPSCASRPCSWPASRRARRSPTSCGAASTPARRRRWSTPRRPRWCWRRSTDAREKSVVASTAAGQVREFAAARALPLLGCAPSAARS